ncbi:MAG: hypothetical protein ACYC6Y_24035, partial [Thermoguttaceae bacterium]
MSRFLAIVVAALTAIVGLASLRGQAVAAEGLEAKARQFVEDLQAGSYSAAAKTFDATMTAAMPADK